MAPWRRREEGGILGASCYTRQVGRRRSWRRVVQFHEIPRRTVGKAVLGSWCYTRKDGQRSSRRIAAQFQGIPSGVSLGTISPEGSRGDPWVLVLYQEGWDSGDPWVLVLYQEDWNSGGPSGGRLDSREFPAVYRSVQIPQETATTRSTPVRARGDGVIGDPSSIPG